MNELLTAAKAAENTDLPYIRTVSWQQAVERRTVRRARRQFALLVAVTLAGVLAYGVAAACGPHSKKCSACQIDGGSL